MEALFELQALRRFVVALQRRLEPSLLRIARSAELGLTEAEEGSPLADELQQARVHCAEAQRLLDRLATFGGQRLPTLQRLSLAHWVASVAPELGRAIAPAVLRLEQAAEGELCVLADPDLLVHALTEVLTNAQQAGAQIATLRLAGHDGAALLQISDDGVGMSETLCERATQPFVTTRRDALGLGLAEVFGIVDQHRGRLVVESTAGEGTTVSVFLPLAAAEHQTALAPRATSVWTLLVAEDEPLVRRTVRHILAPLGHVLLEARCGSEALAIAEQHANPIDLLITDVVMPDIDGIRLATTLCARYPSLRVLFTSGYPAEALSDLPPGADLLQKPFDSAALQRRVSAILRSLRDSKKKPL